MVTTELADPGLDAAHRPDGVARPPGGSLDTAGRPRHVGRTLRVVTGQLVSTQITAILLVAGAIHGTLTLIAAAFPATALLTVTWLRWRGRWAFEWFGIAVRYAARRHTSPLLTAVAPGVRVQQTDLGGHPAAVLLDGYGLTAVLELGAPSGVLAEAVTLPSPAALLSSAAPDSPPCRIQLLLTGVAAAAVSTGNGAPSNSYRQLTGGGIPGHGRALLAIRVDHTDGRCTGETLRALSGLVRKVRRRLGGVSGRPLSAAATVRTLAELAHADCITEAGGDRPATEADEASAAAGTRGVPPAERVEESWSAVRVGGFVQAVFRLARRPDSTAETARLVSRLLALPAAATTVVLTAASGRDLGRTDTALTLTGTAPDVTARAPGVMVRLAAPDVAALATATQALGRAVLAEQAVARRLDGEHLVGLAATLPLGGVAEVDLPGGMPAVPPPTDAASTGAGAGAGADAGAGELAIRPAGLMVGRNRSGGPVVARFFRPEQTQVLLVGGIRCAQLMTLRAMALGARVVVQTTRPQAWERFARGAAVPGESIVVMPAASATQIAPGSALRPVLVVADVGSVGACAESDAAWQATLVVRDEFGATDVDVAARADLLIVQSLRPDEADLLGTAVGLGEIVPWLTRIRADMVGLINRHAVRWAALAQTPIETQLVGPPTRG